VGLPLDALSGLPTPCLVVDLAAAERNIARAEAIATAGDLRLRPHFKAHKCTRLMARQLASGVAIGATCQTAREALVLAGAGVGDILLANEVVTPTDLAIVAEVAERADLTVAVDDLVHVRLLRDALASRGRRLGVVLELDVGSGRCGIEPGNPALLELAEAVTATRGLELRGLLAYEGHLSLKEDPAVREAGMRVVHERIAQAVTDLEAHGQRVDLVTGGGTGTLALVAELRTHDEAQPGSYVLMDATYARSGLGFEPALFCLATVISRPASGRAVLNAGLKALSAEYGMPTMPAGGLEVTRLADEHAVATVTGDRELPIGSDVLLMPAHIDPTINLHGQLHVWDGAVVEPWPVDGRA
jgi:D-serine deaminase-like pyridoxal phosphate-dependent protein